MSKTRMLLVGICAAMGVLVLPPAGASAATINVTTTADEFTDPGPEMGCSLREAIQLANNDITSFGGCAAADEEADVIVLQSGSTYGLSRVGVEDLNASGDLDVRSEPLTIQSTTPGTRATIDANGATTLDRVLDLAPNSAGMAFVLLADLEITDGRSGGASAIRDSGFNPSLTIIGSRIFGNNATAGGAAIRVGASALITNSSIDTNTAADGFAGIWHENGTLTVLGSTISGNTSTGNFASGTGLGLSSGSGATANLINSTVSGNSSTEHGGGIYVQGGTLNLRNATVAGNTADSENNGTGDGGGIFVFINGTSADGTVTSRNSIIGDNVDASSGGGNLHPDCSGPLTSQGYNLVESTSGCTFAVNNDLTGMDPMLGPLANNMGPTLTRALLPGSPALNAANPLTPGSGGMACESTDQRGLSRIPFAPCDIGAYEVQDLDPDGDKSWNAVDACPAQPGPVSNNGCPIPTTNPPTVTVTPTQTTPPPAKKKKCKKRKKRAGAAAKKCKKKKR